jgi:hypothetical protein
MSVQIIRTFVQAGEGHVLIVKLSGERLCGYHADEVRSQELSSMFLWRQSVARTLSFVMGMWDKYSFGADLQVLQGSGETLHES